MDRRFSSLLMALLFLLGSASSPLLEHAKDDSETAETKPSHTLRDAFAGFFSDSNDEMWNQTPWFDVAQPHGFDFL
ncbi:hypothetical protein N9Z48_03200, partial [Euryarchaeota archaeon]|nr:hypothetical protein [Euryarchaeota archaeon]